MRGGSARSRSIRLSQGRLVAAAVGLVLVLAALGGVAGAGIDHLVEARRRARLQERIAQLTREKSDLMSVADRLDRMEAAYEQLRKMMGGELARSDRDVWLPPLPTGAPRAREAESAEDSSDVPSTWPLAVAGFVTRAQTDSTDSSLSAGHAGLDIAVPTGSYVRASADGIVAEAGRDSVYGLFVRLSHRGGLSTIYAHNSRLFVERGDSVRRREVIALSGTTGRSTAPHLHFEIRKNGVPIDPLRFVRADGEQ